ncbi:MAG: radical SAM protein, partial [Halioglobus sp.]
MAATLAEGDVGSATSAQSLRITEIFYSLQGEARTVGRPTVFVRLTGCPLRCGYCDTAYAFSGGELRSIAAVAEEVASHRPQYVTVTGGEPLAQPNCLALLTVLC